MKILMTNTALDQRAGSESYLQTVAAELRRLGHEIVFFSPRCGEFAQRLRDDGFEVHGDVADVSPDVDVIHGQHADAVGLVRTCLPRTPLVFATHSWFVNALEDPAPELGAAAYVAFNDVTHRRLSAHVATRGSEVVRLTQPVAISPGDSARLPLAATPQRAVAVSRRTAQLPVRLAKLCAELGIEFDWVGGPGRESADARREMLAADIVVAMGRTALEAMSAGRAVLVADESTTGGWVSHRSYAALEADGFTGLGNGSTDDDIETLLGDYSPGRGNTARQLAVQHHAAQAHAAHLVELYTSVADTRAEARDPRTVALLAADRYALELRAVGAEWATAEHDRQAAASIGELRANLDQARSAVDRARAESEDLRTEVALLRAEMAALRGQRDRARRRRDQLRRQRNRLRQQVEAVRGRSVRARVAAFVRRTGRGS